MKMRSTPGFWFLALFSLMLAACGGGSSDSRPVISNLSISPPAAYVSSTPLNFGTVFDFSDADGDLSTLTLRILDSAGTTVDLSTAPILGAAGLTEGSIVGELEASGVVADTYTIQIYVTDASNLQSNLLTGSVRIAEFPWVGKLQDPVPRVDAASVELNGKLYVMGGQLINTGTVTSTVTVYDPATDTWSTATPMPTARMGLVAAAYNGKIYAIGGRTDGFSTSAVGTVTVFDPVTNLWTTEPGLMPTPRYFAAAAVLNTTLGPRIVVAGGEAEINVLNAVEAFNPVTGAWTSLAALPTARGQLAMVQANDRLYAVGGYAGLLSQWVGTLEEYNPLIGTWVTRAPMPTPRAHLALTAINGQLQAAGGENVARALDVLEQYDPVANLWSTKTPSPTAFTRAAATVANNRMYIFGNDLTLEYTPANEIR